ncbi:N-acetyl-gamma-glutamyl-phosphate reductase [Alteromonas sp. ASW11-19]|uniref:N-acetyl-gamma-glutamyl-phosphate reductase n=1 Tax=Alteromonas salexigens TaxID=2982530 RepID=A0ABT2VJA9_9ALTE|nr:N-acetyl-gamma-glutamyl-phosphate reductase [Alteromonas salexigens]MCU7553300.1 N-acetyl-gamma-glutamyl-phosphate reductase [Alteromonas salexigens]
MINVAIIGASGYTGAQLVQLIHQHPGMQLAHTFVSQHSADAHQPIAALHGSYAHLPYQLQPLSDEWLVTLSEQMDIIFLATPHEASHDWMETLASGKAKVLDLSGAFRLQDTAVFAQYYGFAHTARSSLDKAVYGLAEWYPAEIRNAHIVAVPGCYPTASLTALKPLAEQTLLDPQVRPVINAVSGVSGAGRKASLTNSFCEVSLQAYGVLGHRHTPEIEAYLGTPVIFTPHLGNFKRGILATVTVKLAAGVTADQVSQAYVDAYAEKPLIRLRDRMPKVDDLANTPFADVHWTVDETAGYAVIGTAIDNVMKGAAAQAVQCANLMCNFSIQTGLTHS